MELNEYQNRAAETLLPTSDNLNYLALGLASEAGEFAGKLAKRRRDGVFDERAFIKELGDILWFVANLADCYDRDYNTNFSADLKDCFAVKADGDNFEDSSMESVAYFVGATVWDDDAYMNDVVAEVGYLAHRYGYTLEQVAEINIAKLRDRQVHGVIKGDGDER